mgnify:CR=1 FL=1
MFKDKCESLNIRDTFLEGGNIIFDDKIILFNRSLLCADKVELLSHDNYDDFLIDKKIIEKIALKKCSTTFS